VRVLEIHTAPVIQLGKGPVMEGVKNELNLECLRVGQMTRRSREEQVVQFCTEVRKNMTFKKLSLAQKG
jgi:hypothetical protein